MNQDHASVLSSLQLFGLIGDRVCGCRLNPSLKKYEKYLTQGHVNLSLTIRNLFRYAWEWITAIFAFDRGGKIVTLFNYGWMKLGFSGQVSVSEILITHPFHPIPFLPTSQEIPLGFLEKENERSNLFFEKLTRHIFLEDGVHDPVRILWEQKLEILKGVFEKNRFNDRGFDISISVKKTVVLEKIFHLEAKFFIGPLDETCYNTSTLVDTELFCWQKEQEIPIHQAISGIADGVFENMETRDLL